MAAVESGAAEAVVRAMYTVATADGTQPLSEMDRKGISTAWATMLDTAELVPVDSLELGSASVPERPTT